MAQDVIVREDDCGTHQGVKVPVAVESAGNEKKYTRHDLIETSVSGRVLASDAADANGNVVVAAGEDLSEERIDALVEAGITEVKVRSVLTCQTPTGVCAKCYGKSMATGKLVDTARPWVSSLLSPLVSLVPS